MSNGENTEQTYGLLPVIRTLPALFRATPAQERQHQRHHQRTQLKVFNTDLVVARARRMSTHALPEVAGPGCGCHEDGMCRDAARLYIGVMARGPQHPLVQEMRAECEAHRATFRGRLAWNERVLAYAVRDYPPTRCAALAPAQEGSA